MKRALCLMHVPFEGPGVFAPALERAGFAIERVLVPQERLPKEPHDFVLIMGGPMSVNDELTWLEAELAFIGDCLARRTPMLGVCLGSQLMAKAAGGTISPGAVVEVGPTRIRKTEAGFRDPVMACLPAACTVFQWHGEGIGLPPAMNSLAVSDDYEVQAFRCHDRAYGLLFHLELDEDGLRMLCRKCPEDLARAGLEADELIRLASVHYASCQRWAVDLVRQLASMA